MRDQERDMATCFAGRNHCCNNMNRIKLKKKGREAMILP